MSEVPIEGEAWPNDFVGPRPSERQSVSAQRQFDVYRDALTDMDMNRADRILRGVERIDGYAVPAEEVIDPWTPLVGTTCEYFFGSCVFKDVALVVLPGVLHGYHDGIRSSLHRHVERTGHLPVVAKQEPDGVPVNFLDVILSAGSMHLEKGLPMVALPASAMWSTPIYRLALLEATFRALQEKASKEVDLFVGQMGRVRLLYQAGVFDHPGAASHGLAGEGGILRRPLKMQDRSQPLLHALCGARLGHFSSTKPEKHKEAADTISLILESAERSGLELAGDDGLANARDPQTGDTPLHKAVKAGNLPLCKTLIRLGADAALRNAAGLRPRELMANPNQDLDMLLAAAEARELAHQALADLSRSRDARCFAP